VFAVNVWEAERLLSFFYIISNISSSAKKFIFLLLWCTSRILL